MTYKSDQIPGTINFYIKNCVPSAATKGTKYEEAELGDSPLLLISDSNKAQLQTVTTSFTPPKLILGRKVPRLVIGKIFVGTHYTEFAICIETVSHPERPGYQAHSLVSSPCFPWPHDTFQ